MRTFIAILVALVVVALLVFGTSYAADCSFALQEYGRLQESLTSAEQRLEVVKDLLEREQRTVKGLREEVEFLKYRNLRARADVGDVLANVRRELSSLEAALSQNIPEPK